MLGMGTGREHQGKRVAMTEGDKYMEQGCVHAGVAMAKHVTYLS